MPINSLKLLAISCFTFLFLSACSSSNKEDLAEKKTEKQQKMDANQAAGVYGYKSGIVEFVYNETKNVQLLYFDNWGTKSAKYVYMIDPDDGKRVLTNIEIRDNESTYKIDPIAKTGLKMDNPFGQGEMGDVAEVLGFQEERKLKMLGANVIGTEKVKGHECEIWEETFEGMTSRTYTHKGLILKAVIAIDNENVTAEATKIDLNVIVPKDKLKVPTGITF